MSMQSTRRLIGAGWIGIAICVCSGCNVPREPESLLDFRCVALGAAAPASRGVRWYHEAGQSQAVVWTSDATGSVRSKFLLQLHVVGSNGPWFSGTPGIRTASTELLLSLPTVVGCRIEGFIAADSAKGMINADAIAPETVHLMLPVSETAPKEMPLPALRHLSSSAGSSGTPEPRKFAVPAATEGAFWLEVTEQEGGGLYVRGYACSSWPDEGAELKGNVAGFVGWIWFQAEWQRRQQSDLTWDQYCEALGTARLYTVPYESVKMREAMVRPGEVCNKDALGAYVQMWRQMTYVMDRALD